MFFPEKTHTLPSLSRIASPVRSTGFECCLGSCAGYLCIDQICCRSEVSGHQDMSSVATDFSNGVTSDAGKIHYLLELAMGK